MLPIATMLAALSAGHAKAQTAPAMPVPAGFAAVATFHAEGAQVYECRAGAGGGLAWQFREPIATLLDGGRTVGRHFAGPRWDVAEGGVVTGRVVERLAGAAADAVPWLRLEITDRHGGGAGRLASATAILRVNTAGGVAEGPCDRAGEFRSVAYAADYVFLAPAR